MGRQITLPPRAGRTPSHAESERGALPPQAPAGDDYSTRVMKYIPGEAVAVYIGVDRVVREMGGEAALLWIAFLVILALTPVYLYRVQKVRAWPQLVVSTLAFAVWVFSLGGPFASTFAEWYRPVYGAVLLPLFTFAVGAIVPWQEGED